MTAKVNRSFVEGHPLLNFLTIKFIGEDGAIAVTLHGNDAGGISGSRPCHRPGAGQQTVLGKIPHVETVEAFAGLMCRCARHFNRGQFSVFPTARHNQGTSGIPLSALLCAVRLANSY